MKYKNLCKPDTFIGQYMQYMESKETAYAYDFWCAVWAIGVCCGRTVYVDRPAARVYLNHYIILCAESGTTRKSTAVNEISGIVESFAPLYTGKTPPAVLESNLHEKALKSGSSTATFAVSELVTILGREGFLTSMPGLLTDLYDCAATRTAGGTLHDGERRHKNIYVNLLSASTPGWMVTAINPAVIEGGFTSRVIFVIDEERKRSIPWGEVSDDDERRDTLRARLNLVSTTAREIKSISINKRGLQHYARWYKSRLQHRDTFQAAFESREDDHVLKLGAILSINDRSFEIGASHIKTAIRIIEHIKSRASSMFGGTIKLEARLGSAVSRSRDLLIAAGSDGIKRSRLANQLQRYLDKYELTLLMKIMHEAGMIQIFEVRTKSQKGKAATVYRATKNIEKFGMVTEVLEKLSLDQD